MELVTKVLIFCLILIKAEMYRQIFVKISGTLKFHGILLCPMRADGPTDA